MLFGYTDLENMNTMDSWEFMAIHDFHFANGNPPGTFATGKVRLQSELIDGPNSEAQRQVSQLEEKIESLVSLLGAHSEALKPDQSSQSINLNATPSDLSSRDSNRATLPFEKAQVETGSFEGFNQEINSGNYILAGTTLLQPPTRRSSQPHRNRSFSVTAQNSCPAQQPPLSNNYDPLFLQPGEEADSVLTNFRENFASHYPYLVFPLHLNSHELQEQKPWVYKAAILVGSIHQRARQISMSKSLCMDVAEAMILKGERNLDMLQSMLIHNAWSLYFSPVTPPIAQSTAVFQLQHALVFDLGLNKPVREGDPSDMLPNNSGVLPKNSVTEAKRTSEERRTLLCAFCSTSVTSLFVRKIENLHHTPYLEYCCKILEDAGEFPSDLILVAATRLQCMSESIQRSLLVKNEGPIIPSCMRAELVSYWQSLSDELRSNEFLLTTYYSVEVFLYEPIIQSNPPSFVFGNGNAQRLEMLSTCLLAVQKLLDLSIAQKVSRFAALSGPQLSFIGLGLSTLFKLSVVEQPGWDLAQVRQSVKIFDYFDHLIKQFEAVSVTADQLHPEPCKLSFSEGCGRALKRTKGVYETKMGVVSGANLVPEHEISGIDGGLPSMEFDWIDDAYWQDMMGGMMGDVFLP
ncbi:hypothetical protein HYFRA_00005946 [Hymenoscyphus fraxineus]|uniref:Transcription factor domain-containing protein n=1 Tax=Hymenoscyphus fraxineus TaxID=746836 RepID=A0A9N9PTA8_9HELO|nr:hypothetical protein HYFRA_00005946 [Hymenoscyphus fraxineus]